ncbi:hypothetical protein [Rhodopirellula sp. MGV]|uniref:hypothetical protein n=1 Tax=Rhodopirellula sp. MGV TaxID=2023130 RepID=UPI000B975B1B|nr:hypothetical protein [Rhodopirellula sp. MGV]OYP34428.1 hypothetical protein CGZ80_15385 [Rhodopirellula sp. MGV]PNY37396.1 hypothetical protein C2E31_07635 [Rhodopirellula baltica]
MRGDNTHAKPVGNAGARKRTGQTMLELVAATTIISVAIAPALGLMRERVIVSADLRHYEWLHCRCIAQLELAMATTSATWNIQNKQGRLGSVDSIPCHFLTVVSDQPSVGGVPGKLAVIDVLTFRDSNRNGTFDAGELHLRLATKVAKTKTYQELANGQ